MDIIQIKKQRESHYIKERLSFLIEVEIKVREWMLEWLENMPIRCLHFANK